MFSVVIPVYNHARYLRLAVESALCSALVSEVILVDDGSSDDSAAIASALAAAYAPRVRDLTVPGEGNRGAHVRLNQLCEAAKHEWICILNSDDLFMPGRFDAIRMAARKTRAEFVTGSMVLINDAGQVLGTKRGISEPEYPYPAELLDANLRTTRAVRQALCNQNFIATTSNMAFTRSLFNRIGGFRNLRYSHDWDFALRASLLAICAHTPTPLTKYRLHDTNTIKEASGHVDGEITRFFFRLLFEFPELESDPICREMLRANRHLGEYVEPEALGRSGPIKPATHDPFTQGAWDDLSPRAAANVAFAMEHYDYDFVTVSAGLTDPPITHIDNLRVRTSYNDAARPLIETGVAPVAPLRGRVIRCAQAEAGPAAQDLRGAPGFAHARFEGQTVIFGDGPRPQFRGPSSSQALRALFGAADARPTVLVLPIFMAVGGVERNTIEIIRRLGEWYRFVVVTTEYQAPHQGSLHYQLDQLGVPCLDLSEVGPNADHVLMLETVKRALDLDLVWICNGSPWLLENAVKLRRVFSDVPIIDQQVYDTEYGWVQSYNSVAIQSFDRFIAINSRIQRKFVQEFRIPRHLVSLIYSAVDAEKLSKGRADPATARQLKINLGLPTDRNSFAFIGRLTAQKRPLDFLGLALRSQNDGRPEEFVLVGDGELSDDCDRFIAANALRNVRRIKYYSDSWATLNAFDGLIITSQFEGLPIVLLEALAFGRPALSTDVGDIALVLGDYGSGQVTNSIGDDEALWRQYLTWLEALPDLTANAVRHAPAVVDRFSAATIADQYDALWRSAIEDVRKPALRG
jgi:glycosyltransferase involved in cell wall biosynthesis